MKEGNLYVVMLQWVVDGCWRRGGSSSECCRYNAQEKTFRQIRPKLKNVDIPSKMSVSIFESFA